MNKLKNFIYGDSIAKHPLNNSKSKQNYSFNKSKRFKNIQTTSVDIFYDQPKAKSNRIVSFGKLKRFNYNNTKVIPDPGIYNITNDFIIKNKKFSFGVGRVF